jgi:hypothetical protein
MSQKKFSISLCNFLLGGRKVVFEIFSIFEILINVIIDPHMLTSPWMTLTPGFKVVQIKEMNYKDWHPRNQFMHLAINVFRFYIKQDDNLLQACANNIWAWMKGPKGPPLLVQCWVIFK